MQQEHAEYFDIAVIGSGAAGLSAALECAVAGLRVVIVEASSLIGGTTAYSEGMVWAPNTPQALALDDASPAKAEAEAAVRYLHATAGNRFNRARAVAYVEAAAPTLAALARNAGLNFSLNRASRDYVPEAPGASHGRRALNPVPISARSMDREVFSKLRAPLPTMVLFGGLTIASRDLPDYQNFCRDPAATVRVLRHLMRFVSDRARGWPRDTRMANGGAIVAALVQGALRAGAQLRCEWPVAEIVMNGGRPCAVRGPRGMIRVTQGVIIATGGNSTSAAARAALVGKGPHVALPPHVDAIDLAILARQTGAAIDDAVSEPMLWTPASVVPQGATRPGPWPHFGDRAKPGVLCVGPDGRRFTNEAQPYHDFVQVMRAETGSHPEGAHCWIIADHRALRRYGLGPIGPFPVRLRPYLSSGYLHRGATVGALAQAIGVPGDTLSRTFAEFNRHAAEGEDPAFQRGRSVYDQGNGDPAHGPNPTLGALDQAPFYAIRMVPGDLGSFVGLQTDANARVLDEAGAVIPGLWAAGNAAAPLMGGSYSAAGLTIGSALVFGWLAARDAAGLTDLGRSVA